MTSKTHGDGWSGEHYPTGTREWMMKKKKSTDIHPDHERIWLQNANDAGDEGRMWCEDKVWPNGPEEGEPTEYMRADLIKKAEADIRMYLARINELENALAEA